MRPHASDRAAVAAVVGAAALLLSAAPPAAMASPCCAGATLMPGRLMVHEEALVGLDLKLRNELGAFDDDATFADSSGTELAFEQGLFGALRVGGSGQLAVRIPLLQTFRSFSGEGETGGGLGDLQIEGRWDFVDAGQYLRLPGIALVASAALPTGRAPEQVTKLLGTDATGTGALQLLAGLQVEQVFDGRIFASAIGSLGTRAPREVRGVEVPASLLLGASGSVGLLLPRDAVLAFSASLASEPDADRRSLRLGLSAGRPLSDDWRVQGGVFSDPPWGGMGRNQQASLGATFVLIRSWT